MKDYSEYKNGDIIECSSQDELLDKTTSLAKHGIFTDWPWIKETGDGKYNLMVTEVDRVD